MLKKIFSHSILYAIGPQIPKIVGFFLLPLLTKHLTADDYGIYGIATAYIGALSGIKDLGFQQTLVNVFFKAKGNKKRWINSWRQQMGILMIWNIFYCILLAIIIFFSLKAYLHYQIYLLISILVFPSLFFETIVGFGYRYFQLSQKPIFISINTAIVGIVTIIINYYTIVYLNFHFWGFFVANAIGICLSAFFFIYPLLIKYKITPLFYFKKNQLRKYFRVSLPTIPHNYSSYLLNASDRIILQLYKTPMNKMGEYNFAYMIGNFADFIGNAVGTAIGPFYNKEYAKRNNEGYTNAKDLTLIMQLSFLYISFTICIWIKEIFKVLSSNIELSNSYPIAIIILMSYSFRPMYWAFVSRMGFEEQTKYLWKISFTGGIINIVLNFILIPFYGILASALATLIGLLYIGFAGFAINTYKKINTKNYYPIYWIIIILFLTICVYYLKDFSYLIKGIISIVTFIIFLKYFLSSPIIAKKKATFQK